MIVYITLLIILIALALFIAGKGWLVYNGFKYSAGIGLGMLLIPLMTPWFAFYKLEKEGKERWITMWAAGAVIATITILTFLPTVQDVVSGEAFKPGYGTAAATTTKKGTKTEEKKEEAPKVEEKKEEAKAEGKAEAADDKAPAAAGAAAPAAGDAKAPAAGDAKAPAAGDAKAP